MWWHGPPSSCSNASFNECVPVRPTPAPTTASATTPPTAAPDDAERCEARTVRDSAPTVGAGPCGKSTGQVSAATVGERGAVAASHERPPGPAGMTPLDRD